MALRTFAITGLLTFATEAARVGRDAAKGLTEEERQRRSDDELEEVDIEEESFNVYDEEHLEDTFDRDDDHSIEQGAEDRIIQPGEDTEISAMSNLSASSKCASGSGRRVVSVGDQHGDFDSLVDHLRRLGLSSSSVTRDSSTWRTAWRGGNAIFVQTGDILDRGPDGQIMYKFLWALQDDAPRSGGEVVLLPGNHELMVLQGDVRYVTDKDFCTYHSRRRTCSGSGNYPSSPCTYGNGKCRSSSGSCMEGNCEFLEAWDKSGSMGAEMRKRFREGKMKVAYKVNGIVFSHAGLVNSLWGKVSHGSGSDPIDKLNNLGARLFSRNTGYDLYYSSDVIAATGSQGGPLWTRVCYDDWYTRAGRRRSGGSSMPYYMDKNEYGRVANGRCRSIAKSLSDVGGKRMVIGHCPQRSGKVRLSCSGTFVEADTYMSKAYTGSTSTSKRNMAAIEFYSRDSKHQAWIVYSGRGVCEKLPSV